MESRATFGPRPSDYRTPNVLYYASSKKKNTTVGGSASRPGEERGGKGQPTAVFYQKRGGSYQSVGWARARLVEGRSQHAREKSLRGVDRQGDYINSWKTRRPAWASPR